MRKDIAIQYIATDKLKLNAKNPRKNDAAVDTVAKSIEKYGFKNPVIADSSLVVYCGNTRLKAARKLGLPSIPVIIADDLTAKEIRELAIIDNKSSEIAEWDMDMLADELEDLDLGDFDLDFGIISPDDYGEEFSLPDGEKSEFCQMTFTLHNKQAELIQYAIDKVKDDITETFGNANGNGNALYEVVRQWAKQKK